MRRRRRRRRDASEVAEGGGQADRPLLRLLLLRRLSLPAAVQDYIFLGSECARRQQ
uniref:Uncharacterized protein n=1 Tax=Arundo donax TaxID=35708 RepID=A0A0A9FPQ7_ARUDO